MKKYISIIIAIFALTLTTCTNEGREFDTHGGNGLAFVHFVGSSITLSTELEEMEDAPHSATISVSSTVKSEQARTYTLQIDPSSTAIEGTHYNLSSKTVTIPAGQYSGSVTITVIIDNLVKDRLSAVFILDSDDVIDYGKKMTVIMNRYDLCEFETSMLVGTFNYVSDDWDEEGIVKIEADPDDPYKIYILSPLSEDITWNENPIVVYVDPETYTITGPKCVVIDSLDEWGVPWTNYFCEAVDGVFDYCTGTYTISFHLGCDQQDFGPNEYILSR